MFVIYNRFSNGNFPILKDSIYALNKTSYIKLFEPALFLIKLVLLAIDIRYNGFRDENFYAFERHFHSKHINLVMIITK